MNPTTFWSECAVDWLAVTLHELDAKEATARFAARVKKLGALDPTTVARIARYEAALAGAARALYGDATFIHQLNNTLAGVLSSLEIVEAAYTDHPAMLDAVSEEERVELVTAIHLAREAVLRLAARVADESMRAIR